MFTNQNPIQNRLLATLPDDAFNLFSAHLELVDMPLGEELYQSGEQPNYVYFPTTAIVSLLTVLDDGALSEIAVVGGEGVVGIFQLLVGDVAPRRAVVRTGGFGYRMKMQLLQYEFNRGGAVLRLLLRYAKVLNVEMAQTNECNQHHSLAKKLCRWLLLSVDRMPLNTLVVTPTFIAKLMGERSKDVVTEIRNLQYAGLVRFGLDSLVILDRAGLKKAACECYDLIKAGFDCLHTGVSGIDPALIHKHFNRRAMLRRLAAGQSDRRASPGRKPLQRIDRRTLDDRRLVIDGSVGLEQHRA